MTDTVQQALITAVAGLLTVWLTTHSTNKKTKKEAEETNRLVVAAKIQSETNGQKIDAVHEIANGNLSAEKARGDALATEVSSLKAQLKRRAPKRRTDS